MRKKFRIAKTKVNFRVIITRLLLRHGENSICRHVVGYINSDYIGQSGLKRIWRIFNGNQYAKVGVISDRVQRPLVGYGYRAVEISNNVQNIKLTLDCHFQK